MPRTERDRQESIFPLLEIVPDACGVSLPCERAGSVKVRVRRLDADAFRLSLPRAAIGTATAAQPPGDGPLLLLAPAGVPGDWPEERWQGLPAHIRTTIPGLRSQVLAPVSPAAAVAGAAEVATADVVLASDPLSEELALLSGVPLVALGRDPATLPKRAGVAGLTAAEGLSALDDRVVLTALGLG